MPNTSSTSVAEAFPRDPLPRAFGSTFDPSSAAQTTVEPSRPLSKAHVQAAPTHLITLLAKSLGACRSDWRNHRITLTAYASSRVSYVEAKMTEEQSREFE